MKLLITSDVHGDYDRLKKVCEKHKDIPHHLNAGDMVLHEQHYLPYMIITVKGNNDYGVDAPLIRLINIDNQKIMLVHGHQEYVKYGLERLKLKAKLHEANIVIFGHTHKRYLMVEEDILFINPGALGDFMGSYAIYEDGQVTFYEEKL